MNKVGGGAAASETSPQTDAPKADVDTASTDADKKPRVMTVADIKKELEGASMVSNDVKNLILAENRGVLDVLSISPSKWDAVIKALFDAGVENIDDLMLTARFVELDEVSTLEKLRKAGLGDATFLGKLRHFARRPGVKITTDDALPTTTAAVSTQGGEQTNRCLLYTSPSPRD